MFSVILYALMRGERSSRRMEDLCAYDVRFWFLSGGTRPDHTKFCRFRRSLDVDGELDHLMLLVVEKAALSGLVKGKTVVVDGTKIPTSGSQWRKYLKETESADEAQEEERPKDPPPAPAVKKRGRKPKAMKPKPKVNFKPPSDAEARTMKTTHGEFVVGYNLQIAQDMSSGVVLGAVATNQNDCRALDGLLDATATQSKVVPHRVVGDKGYDTPANLATLEKRNARSYVVPKRVTPAPFKADEHGVMRCLAGHATTQFTTTKDGNLYTTYRVNRCRACPLMQACGKTAKSHQREMNVRSDEHFKANEQNRRRCKSDPGKKLLKMRGQTIERTNARIKRDYRMRRLNLQGLAGARIELLVACIALNLETILKAATRLFMLLFALANANRCNKQPQKERTDTLRYSCAI